MNPNKAIRVLLGVDAIYLAKVIADTSNLVLDIHEEGWIFLQVDLSGIEHALEQDAVTLSYVLLPLKVRTIFLAFSTRSLSVVGSPARQNWVLVPAQLLHESCAVLSRVDICVSCILTKVFLFVSSFLARSISQNIDLELLTSHQFKTIHGLGCDASLLVCGKLNNRMSSVVASVRVFGQLNCVNLAKGREELANVLLSQCG